MFNSRGGEPPGKDPWREPSHVRGTHTATCLITKPTRLYTELLRGLRYPPVFANASERRAERKRCICAACGCLGVCVLAWS